MSSSQSEKSDRSSKPHRRNFGGLLCASPGSKKPQTKRQKVNSHHTRHAMHTALEMAEQIEPLSRSKDPIVAALCGLFLGGLGLGLHFKSWRDFAIPVVLWVLCTLFAPATVGDFVHPLRHVLHGILIPACQGLKGEARLTRLTELRDRRLISDAEFQSKRQDILSNL